MSRGLGRVQREILDTIDALPWWHAISGWHDLRAIKKQVALLDESRTYGSHNQWCHGSFDVTFHRATHALVKRGLLERAHDAPDTSQLRYVRRPKC